MPTGNNIENSGTSIPKPVLQNNIETCSAAKFQYLKKNSIPYDRIITRVTDKYTYLQKCEYFIDDDIINCEQAIEKTNCKVIMMSTPKTKGYTNSNISIVNNWQEVYEIISNQRN